MIPAEESPLQMILHPEQGSSEFASGSFSKYNKFVSFQRPVLNKLLSCSLGIRGKVKVFFGFNSFTSKANPNLNVFLNICLLYND